MAVHLRSAIELLILFEKKNNNNNYFLPLSSHVSRIARGLEIPPERPVPITPVVQAINNTLTA